MLRLVALQLVAPDPLPTVIRGALTFPTCDEMHAVQVPDATLSLDAPTSPQVLIQRTTQDLDPTAQASNSSTSPSQNITPGGCNGDEGNWLSL